MLNIVSEEIGSECKNQPTTVEHSSIVRDFGQRKN